jgi:hypothetical protein
MKAENFVCFSKLYSFPLSIAKNNGGKSCFYILYILISSKLKVEAFFSFFLSVIACENPKLLKNKKNGEI